MTRFAAVARRLEAERRGLAGLAGGGRRAHPPASPDRDPGSPISEVGHAPATDNRFCTKCARPPRAAAESCALEHPFLFLAPWRCLLIAKAKRGEGRAFWPADHAGERRGPFGSLLVAGEVVPPRCRFSFARREPLQFARFA